MPIGVGFSPYGKTYARYAEEKYVKIRQHGYTAVDLDFFDTNTEAYLLTEDELRQKMLEEKSSADNAGVRISQIHGPWRCPPFDATE